MERTEEHCNRVFQAEGADDAVSLDEDHCAFEDGNRACLLLVGQDFGIGEPLPSRGPCRKPCDCSGRAGRR